MKTCCYGWAIEANQTAAHISQYPFINKSCKFAIVWDFSIMRQGGNLKCYRHLPATTHVQKTSRKILNKKFTKSPSPPCQTSGTNAQGPRGDIPPCNTQRILQDPLPMFEGIIGTYEKMARETVFLKGRSSINTFCVNRASSGLSIICGEQRRCQLVWILLSLASALC